jgi:putative ABC transport system permease protein
MLLSLGVAVISLVLVVSHQLQQQFNKNSKGIGMVIGAKGSPLQLILSSIYQIDAPTGNIKKYEADAIAKHRLVKFGIPLSFGDNYKGYRIVGTTTDYFNHFEAIAESGHLPHATMEVAVGAIAAANLELKVGNTFYGAHGFDDAGHVHDELAYRVSAVLAYNNSVVDNLILTPLESVWDMHASHNHEAEHEQHQEHHHEHEHGHEHEHEHTHEHETKVDSTAEITAMLIGFKSPLGAIQLPRYINENTNMQSALPAIEINRLFGLLGIGFSAIQALALVLLIISGLSIFIALYTAIKERKYELAVMRTLGATRAQLLQLVLLEGFWLSSIGLVVGFILSKVALLILMQLFGSSLHIQLQLFSVESGEWLLIPAIFGIGLFSALIPALQAQKLDISKLLSTP